MRPVFRLLLIVIFMTNIQGKTIDYDDGGVYSGDVNDDGIREGNGIKTYPSGNRYEGEWEDGLKHGQGVFTWTDGERYEGEFKQGKKNGHGVNNYPSGSRYEGEWKDGLKHGKGVITWGPESEWAGDKYEGEYKKDKINGHGVYNYASGSRYEGEWEDGLKHGQGIYTWTSGSRYEGEWKKDKKNGHGVYHYANGKIYEGEYKDGMRHGHGVFTWTSGNRYEGEWDDGQKDGQGVYTWADGDIFEGEYKQDKKNGHGVYNFADGDRYEGEFKQDKRNGHGVYNYADGERYEGEYKQGKKNGWGRYFYKNKDNWAEYDGEWINKVKTGNGTMLYTDGSIYNGQWSSDIREGKGLLLWPNGTSFYGQMKNDEIYHGMTMTPDVVFTYPPSKSASYNGKGFEVFNVTGGEIECFHVEKNISCYNKPNEVETIYLSGLDHYFTGDTISIRKRKVIDGFGEYGVDGGYYIGEWKQGIQTGFGLKNEPFSATLVGTFEDGILEGIGASVSYSSKYRTVYFGGYRKGKPDGPGIFIYPGGEKVIGYSIEGKLVHTKNPIYLHKDGVRDILVPTRG